MLFFLLVNFFAELILSRFTGYGTLWHVPSSLCKVMDRPDYNYACTTDLHQVLKQQVDAQVLWVQVQVLQSQLASTSSALA